jgi:hypothetical protein
MGAPSLKIKIVIKSRAPIAEKAKSINVFSMNFSFIVLSSPC